MKFAALLFVLVIGGMAWADNPVVVATGEAPGTGDSARLRALDQAFANAIKRALAELVPGEVLREKDAILRDQLLTRSRRFIASYQMQSENISGGAGSQKYVVRIAASVDREKLRERLAELGIRAATPQAGLSGRPKAVILVREIGPRSSMVNFGSDARVGPCATAFTQVIQSLGFQVVTPPAAGTFSLDKELDAPGAIAMAKSVDAGVVFVVDATVIGAGRLHGTTDVAAEGQAQTRIYDVGREAALADASVTGIGFGPGLTEATARAATELGQKLARAVSKQVGTIWPTATDEREDVKVFIAGAHSWGPIAALIRAIAAGSGLKAIHANALGQGKVVLGLSTSLSAAQIELILSRTKLPSGELSAHAEGDRVVVTISGEESLSPGDVPVMEGE